ncbi:MAG: STAS domain-containing protein [Anaerolineales bacterium]
MEIKHTQLKRCDLIKIIGRIDSYTAPQLEEAFNEITNAGRFKLVLDMSDVDFVSSRGWWVLIDNQKRCKRFNRGEVVLAGLQENIRDSLNLVGMGKYFKLFDDVTTAVGSF